MSACANEKSISRVRENKKREKDITVEKRRKKEKRKMCDDHQSVFFSIELLMLLFECVIGSINVSEELCGV